MDLDFEVVEDKRAVLLREVHFVIHSLQRSVFGVFVHNKYLLLAQVEKSVFVGDSGLSQLNGRLLLPPNAEFGVVLDVLNDLVLADDFGILTQNIQQEEKLGEIVFGLVEIYGLVFEFDPRGIDVLADFAPEAVPISIVHFAGHLLYAAFLSQPQYQTGDMYSVDLGTLADFQGVRVLLARSRQTNSAGEGLRVVHS